MPHIPPCPVAISLAVSPETWQKLQREAVETGLSVHELMRMKLACTTQPRLRPAFEMALSPSLN